MRNITPRTPHPTTLSLPSSSTLVPDLIGDPGHLRGSRVFAFFIREDKDSGSPIGVGDDRGEVLAGFRPRTTRGRFCGVSAPHAEVLLFRQKDPKPLAPGRGPTGAFATVPNVRAAELASLKQSSPPTRIRDWGAAPPAGALEMAPCDGAGRNASTPGQSPGQA